MKTHSLYPLTFHPIYRNYLWGGDAIAANYNRANTPRPCAESWELSALPGNESVVAQGAFEGCGIGELSRLFGRDLLGTKAPNPEIFPLLIKVLDVHERLSVQVHPDSEAAAALGGQPKHEMWYVLRAQPGAALYAGLTPGATFETVMDHLVDYTTMQGDVFDIRPGLIHTIGAGNLIYEVQQTSDTTYRVDDWGRGRELHPVQARRAIRWDLAATVSHAADTAKRDLLPRLCTPDFTFATLRLDRVRTLHTTAQSFMVLFCTTGKTTLEHSGPHPLTLLPGDLTLIPPGQSVTLHPFAPTRLLVSAL